MTKALCPLSSRPVPCLDLGTPVHGPGRRLLLELENARGVVKVSLVDKKSILDIFRERTGVPVVHCSIIANLDLAYNGFMRLSLVDWMTAALYSMSSRFLCCLYCI